MACHLFGTKPLSKPLLSYSQMGFKEQSENLLKIKNFSFTKMHLKILSAKWGPFCLQWDVLTKANGHSGYIWYLLSSMTIFSSFHSLEYIPWEPSSHHDYLCISVVSHVFHILIFIQFTQASANKLEMFLIYDIFSLAFHLDYERTQ